MVEALIPGLHEVLHLEAEDDHGEEEDGHEEDGHHSHDLIFHQEKLEDEPVVGLHTVFHAFHIHKTRFVLAVVENGPGYEEETAEHEGEYDVRNVRVGSFVDLVIFWIRTQHKNDDL